MKSTITPLLLLTASSFVHAQTATSLDEDAAKRALSTVPQRPKFISKGVPAVVKSRTYTKSKGIDVEIIERVDGTKEEMPFINLPVQFVVDSDELLGASSRENLRRIGEIMRQEIASAPNACFKIEGHTSSEGAEDHNQLLSEKRARKIVEVLTIAGIPEHALKSEGLGESQAKIPETAPESQRQQERRVIVGRDR